MFQNEELKTHLETSSTIKSQSAIIAEWNMNFFENISKVGNYRYDPSSTTAFIPMTYDENDEGNFYTGATDADTTIDAGIGEDNEPITFQSKKTKEKLLYSLEDCFGKFRPRSGINKLRYFGDTPNSRFLQYDSPDMTKRPRYYMSSDTDAFKYWTSYRTESGVEKGVANKAALVVEGQATDPYGEFYIADASPFVVYKNEVAANRIVVKMQTHVGSKNSGPFYSTTAEYKNGDPVYGYENSRTPLQWKIQYLQGTQWVDAISFNQSSTRKDGSPVVRSDGYVEVSYGLKVPARYQSFFAHVGEISSTMARPVESIKGYAYLLKTSDTDRGVYHIWMGSGYETFIPEYGWQLTEEDTDRRSNFAKDLTTPNTFIDPSNINRPEYREFKKLSGLRVVVSTMKRQDSTLDLIELSPRLAVDLTDKAKSFTITKMASDIGSTGMPVGQLLASTGKLELFDYDQAFIETNTNSVIKDVISSNFQIKFYEIISEVNGADYYVPIKAMYSEGFPSIGQNRSVSLTLRDLFLQFESNIAPQILVRDVSLSYAVSLLLDSIGFSNYVFKRNPDESEINIPFFFISPNTTVAEVLNQLAISAQAAMFFDEYNNFVVMSKGYLMPLPTERATSFTLRGSVDQQISGGIKNQDKSTEIANIIDISSRDDEVFNDGKITYTSRAIQRTYAGIEQYAKLDADKNWRYKPVVLWEASGSETVRSVNGESANQSAYSLSAIPLKTTLSSVVPTVSNNQLINNTMDLGESVYNMSRYSGYLYANGEVIRFDAIQYNVPGLATYSSSGSNNVWISSVKEYQNYFSKLPFNGKMYPTGLIRIYAKPEYETISGKTVMKNGNVLKHGRGQFNTPVVDHLAGLDAYWSTNTNTYGRKMDSKKLFETSEIIVLSNVNLSAGGTVITVSDASRIKVGYTVTLASSSATGQLSIAGDTLVQSISGNNITLSRGVEKALSSATLNVQDITRSNGTELAIVNTDENILARTSSRNGVIKNLLASEIIEESELQKMTVSQAGTIQSSALVFNGPTFAATDNPRDFISYVHKPLTESYKHFGTRLRIIGKKDATTAGGQTPTGSSPFLTATTVSNTLTATQISIGSASGGMAVMMNPATGVGYYFEIAAFTANKLAGYSANGNLHNVFFYKLTNQNTTSPATPVKLWSDFTSILVDDGKFTGQSRVVGETNPTVYDLSVEYEDVGTTRKFYLYINDVRIATVEDKLPLPKYSGMSLFVRGSARLMFENIYAIGNNYSQNYNYSINAPISATFKGDQISSDNSFRRYAMSGVVQSSYLSGISPGSLPEYNMYFEEFGTIMREMSYFKVKYDKAYPALYSQIVPTFNKLKGYVVSGYTPDAYGTEFLVFNATDTTLVLDNETQNYLKIQGITFTQESNEEITVDTYFAERSNSADPTYSSSDIVSPTRIKEEYNSIKFSRMNHGRKEFSISAPFIQSQDAANDLLGWVVSRLLKPKKSVGIKIFANPMIQLGDIVTVDYKTKDGVNQVGSPEDRFVVYNIEYSKNNSGPSMTIYLSEVV